MAVEPGSLGRRGTWLTLAIGVAGCGVAVLTVRHLAPRVDAERETQHSAAAPSPLPDDRTGQESTAPADFAIGGDRAEVMEPHPARLLDPTTAGDGQGGETATAAVDALSAYNEFLGAWPDLQKIDGPTWVGKRPVFRDAVFEEKYAGFGPAELTKARDSVADEFSRSRRASYDARYEAGAFEVRVIERGRPFHTGPVGADAPFTRYLRAANSNEVHIISLPFEEYSNLYELDDELCWLSRKCGKVE